MYYCDKGHFICFAFYMWIPRDLLPVRILPTMKIFLIFFSLHYPTPLFLCGKLALRSIFLSNPWQNSNAVHAPLAWKHYKSYFSYDRNILH